MIVSENMTRTRKIKFKLDPKTIKNKERMKITKVSIVAKAMKMCGNISLVAPHLMGKYIKNGVTKKKGYKTIQKMLRYCVWCIGLKYCII